MELAFKRLKSIMPLGQFLKNDTIGSMLLLNYFNAYGPPLKKFPVERQREGLRLYSVEGIPGRSRRDEILSGMAQGGDLWAAEVESFLCLTFSVL